MPVSVPRGPGRALLLALAVATLLYLPGLQGPFIFDDFPALLVLLRQRDPSLPWQFEDLLLAASSGSAGPSGRPIPVVTFHVQAWLGNFSPIALKGVNLAIHLVNGVLVVALLERIRNAPALDRFRESAAARWIAVLSAAVWLVHPIHVTSVLYVVQRMNSLAATFALLALIAWVSGRLRLEQGRSSYGMITVSLALTALGVLAKETAALVPLYALVIEVTLFSRMATVAPRPVQVYFLATLVLPAVALLVAGQGLGSVFSGYAFRDFTPCERLVTQGNVLGGYLHTLLLPSPERLSLFLDDQPVLDCTLASTLSWLGWAGALVPAVLVRRRNPLPLFGLLWFLAGHVLESTILPLEMAFEHRNYLPGVGIILLAAGLALEVPRSGRRAVTVVACLWVGMLCGSLLHRTSIWADPLALALHHVASHPGSALAQGEAGRIFGQAATEPEAPPGYKKLASDFYLEAARLDSTSVVSLSNRVILLHRLGDPEVSEALDMLDQRLKTSRLHQATARALDNLVAHLLMSPQQPYTHRVLDLYLHTLSNPNLYPLLRQDIEASLAALYSRISDVDASEGILGDLIAQHPESLELRKQQIAQRLRRHDYRAAMDAVVDCERHIAKLASPLARIVAQRNIQRFLHQDTFVDHDG